MRVTCAISGIRFEVSYMQDITIQHTEGYFHPIFALPQRPLYTLYQKHCRGQLLPVDSYLLFMAFLHSSGKIQWDHPAAVTPNDARVKKLVANNIAQLVRVLEKSAVIRHPGFKQPGFKMTYHTADLSYIGNWIKAWEDNIEFFNRTRADIRTRQSLLEIESKLSYLILSGEKPEKFAHVIANWASEAAGFPAHKDEEWRKVIRSCFNITKMFNTPLSLLKEIKDYCECNIEAGSIHFHTLCEVLKEGISRHVDYLGGSSLALGYTILPTLSTGSALGDRALEQKNKAELLTIAATAGEFPPVRTDYPNELAFIKARLAYRVAKNVAKRDAIEAEAEMKRIAAASLLPTQTPKPEDNL